MNIRMINATAVATSIQIIAALSEIRCMKKPRTRLPLIVAIVIARKNASMKDTSRKLTNTVITVRTPSAMKTLI
tara:strand:+ start:1064 stop:1285 length:222 start_codon:yes stop_codon:yes gene_type:complete